MAETQDVKPSKVRFAPLPDERRIDLPGLLDDVVGEGFISRRQAEDILIAPRTKREPSLHPIEIVAEEPVDEAAWHLLARALKVKAPQRVCAPVGCLECRDTGFYGRIGLYEVMTLSESLQEQIKDASDVDSMRRQAMKEGMRTLRLAGAQKVGAGLTTINEVLRVVPISHG